MSKIYYEVNNVDVSQYVQAESLSIYNRLTNNPDTASFMMYNPATEPLEGQDVKIYLDTTSQMLFGGIITGAMRLTLAFGSIYSYTITCSDYERLFNRRLVTEHYEAIPPFYLTPTVYSVIQDIVTNYTSGFTINNVVGAGALTGIVNDYIFDYRYPSDCLRELCRIEGMDWYIDTDKDLHFFFGKEDSPAPLIINNNTLQSTIETFSINSDYTQIRNKVFVEGGYSLSNEVTEIRIADGVQRTWNLPYSPHDLTVKVGGVTQTLGQENVDSDDGTKEYFYNYYEKIVKCAAAEPTPADGVQMSFLFKFETPIIVSSQDDTSIADIAGVEGGDGIYEYIIKDNTIQTRELAEAYARLQLKKYAYPKITGIFTVKDYYGFKAGQYISVALGSSYRYDGDYIIKQVLINSLGNNILQYTIEFGEFEYGG